MFKKIKELRVRIAMDTKRRMLLYGAAVILNIVNLWAISQNHLPDVITGIIIAATIMIYVITGGIRAFLAPIRYIAVAFGKIVSMCSIVMGPVCILVIPLCSISGWLIAPLLLFLGTYFCPAILVPMISHYYRQQIDERLTFEV